MIEILTISGVALLLFAAFKPSTGVTNQTPVQEPPYQQAWGTTDRSGDLITPSPGAGGGTPVGGGGDFRRRVLRNGLTNYGIAGNPNTTVTPSQLKNNLTNAGGYPGGGTGTFVRGSTGSPVPSVGRVAGSPHTGGGGAENLGAPAIQDIVKKTPTVQPSWWETGNGEYIGKAADSIKPLLAGGGLDQHADDFRMLGDKYGARQ